MKRYLIGTVIALTAELFGAGTAYADTDSYLADLQNQAPYIVQKYGTQALMDEGYRVCNWATQGVPDIEPGGIVDRIKNDLPMSDDGAISVQVAAENDLGC